MMAKKLGQWLKDSKWLLIGLMWIVAFCLGYVGFSNYYVSIGETRSTWHTFYVTMQLFVLESGAVTGPIGWELQVARFLAPLVAIYTAIQAVAIILREQLLLFRLRFLKGHIVICGLGRKGLLLCRAFCRSGERVTLIEHNKDNELISQCREYGAAMLIDNAASASVLRRAGVDRAKYVISVCGDDGTNAEIAVHSRELVQERKGRVLSCLAHIQDAQLCDLLREKEIGMGRPDNFRLELFNVFESGARILLAEYPPFLDTDIADEPTPHIVVVGVGRMGESLVVNAARKWWNRQTKDGERLRITLVDRNAESIKNSLCLRYPRIEVECELLSRQMDVRDTDFEQGDFLFDRQGRCDVTTVYVCLDGDSNALSAALILRQKLLAYEVPIIVRMTDYTGLATLLQGGKESEEYFTNLHAFGLFDRVCTPGLITGCTTEIIAYAIHEEYMRNEIEKGVTLETNPSLVSWEHLPEAIKESNRSQAEHIRVKLQTIGCDIALTTDWEVQPLELTPEEVELMAKMEHDRFVEERLCQGFRYGEKKDLREKTTPALVSWEDLPESEKQKDRDLVRGLSTVLAKAGFRIYRRKASGENNRFN